MLSAICGYNDGGISWGWLPIIADKLMPAKDARPPKDEFVRPSDSCGTNVEEALYFTGETIAKIIPKTANNMVVLITKRFATYAVFNKAIRSISSSLFVFINHAFIESKILLKGLKRRLLK